jgi:hypothetical protein
VKRIGSPHTRVIGVETFDGDAMARSLEKGERVTLAEVGPFSDGTAVRIVGEEPFRICQTLLDGVVKVDNDEICAAIKDIFEGTHARMHASWPPARGSSTLRHDHHVKKSKFQSSFQRHVPLRNPRVRSRLPGSKGTYWTISLSEQPKNSSSWSAERI